MSVYHLDGQTNLGAKEIFALLKNEPDLPWAAGGHHFVVLGHDEEKGLWWGRSGDRPVCLKILQSSWRSEYAGFLMEELLTFEKCEGTLYAFYVLIPGQNEFQGIPAGKTPSATYFYEFSCLSRKGEKAIALKTVQQPARSRTLGEKGGASFVREEPQIQPHSKKDLTARELSDFIDLGVELRCRFGQTKN